MARITPGQPMVFKNINTVPQPENGEAPRLGKDALANYSAVVFDLDAMTFSVGPLKALSAGQKALS